MKSLFLDDFLFGSLGSADEDDFAMSLGNMASYPGSTTEPLFQEGKTWLYLTPLMISSFLLNFFVENYCNNTRRSGEARISNCKNLNLKSKNE